jgi:predicted RNA-binding protein YlxR (DUF448 family)
MSARPRHVPARTCVGCRQEQPKRQLVRVVRGPDGVVAVDPTGKAPGRGAYVCRRADCWAAALRRDMLGGALRASLAPADRAALESFAATLATAPGLSGV